MKKAITIFFVAFLLLSLTSCGGTANINDEGKASGGNPTAIAHTTEPTPEPTNNSTPEPTAEPVEAVWGKWKGFNAEIINTDIQNNSKGDPCLIVQYAFSHDLDKATSFGMSVKHAAFQGGIELQDAYLGILSDDKEYDNFMTDIKAGVPITVKRSYLLNDNEDVEIELSELISFNRTVYTQMVEVI